MCITILNVTYPDPKIKSKIDALVGKSFSFFQRITKKGIGSRRMIIDDHSNVFSPYLLQKHYLTYSNIELRPNGIIIYIHKKLENYVWVIPYEKLSISKKGAHLLIYQHDDFLLFRSAYQFNAAFIEKINHAIDDSRINE